MIVFGAFYYLLVVSRSRLNVVHRDVERKHAKRCEVFL